MLSLRIFAFLLVMNSLVPVDSFGATPAFQWVQQVGPSSETSGGSRATALAVDGLGNCFVTGRFKTSADFNGTNLISYGGSDVFVAKYESTGALLWVRQGRGGDDDEGRGIAVDGTGNCYVVGDFGFGSGRPVDWGTTNLASSGKSDAFIAKYDDRGALQWVRAIGGADFERGNGIAADHQGNCWVVGSSGNGGVFINQYTSSGSLQWQQRGNSAYASGTSIAVDNVGNCYATGRFSDAITFGNVILTNSGLMDIFTAKYSVDGALQWAIQAGGERYNEPRGVATDQAGNCYLTGYFSSQARFGSLTAVSAGTYDAFLAKYSPSGASLWVQSIGGPSSEYGTAVATDANGYSYLTGLFDRSLMLGTNQFIASQQSLFVAQYDSSGTVQWAMQGGETNYSESGAIAVDQSLAVFLAGSFSASFTLGGHPLGPARAGGDMFLAKLARNQVPPTVIIPPESRTSRLGESFTLRSLASGNQPLHYQWQFNGTNILGAANSELKIIGAGLDRAGDYRVILTNPIGATTSSVAVVTIKPFPPAPDFTWVQEAWGPGNEGSYRFWCRQLVLDAAGTCYVAGSIWYPHRGLAFFGSNKQIEIQAFEDAFLACYNRNGALQWVRQVTERSFDFYGCNGVAVDADGNSYLIGTVIYNGPPGSSRSQSFFARYDRYGNQQWLKFSQQLSRNVSFDRIAATPTGQLFLLVTEDGSPYLERADSAGNATRLMPVWASDLAADGTTGVVLGGTFSGSRTLGPTNLVSHGNTDGFVAKCNTNGVLEWVEQIGGTNSDRGTSVRRVTVDGAGNVFALGWFQGAARFGSITLNSLGRTDVFLAKYDKLGTCLWVRQIQGNFDLFVSDDSFLNTVCTDKEGNAYVASRFSQTAWFDEVPLMSAAGTDAFMVSYDSGGNLRWLQQASGPFGVDAAGIGVDGNGGAYVAGTFVAPANFGTKVATNGSHGLFLAKLPSNPPFAPPLKITRSENTIVISWNAASAVLEKAAAVTGPWTTVDGASSPLAVPATTAPRFYRLRQP